MTISPRNRALFGLSIALGVSYLFVTLDPPGVFRSIWKTLPVTLLAVAILGRAPRLLAAGLGFGALGDLLLSIPGQGWFLAGMAAFLAGHLCYATHFLRDRRPLAEAPLLWVLPVLYVAGAATFLATVLPNAGAFAVPFAAYGSVILGTCVLALRARGGQPLMGLGMSFFVVSDGMIAADMFGPEKLFGGWIWATYYAAQFLISLGALRLSPEPSRAEPGK